MNQSVAIVSTTDGLQINMLTVYTNIASYLNNRVKTISGRRAPGGGAKPSQPNEYGPLRATDYMIVAL